MSFLLACPLCGPRDVYEFRFGGEVQKNLLFLFFATEEIKKETGTSDPNARPRPVTRVGVLGAGRLVRAMTDAGIEFACS